MSTQALLAMLSALAMVPVHQMFLMLNRNNIFFFVLGNIWCFFPHELSVGVFYVIAKINCVAFCFCETGNI